MSRAARRRKAEELLGRLEKEFTARLIEVLRECSIGRWGLFGHNDHLGLSRSTAPELIELGDRIVSLRSEIGIVGPFPPYERFLTYRNMRGRNVPGEPRLAAALLGELAGEE